MVCHRVSDAIRQNVSHPVPLRNLVAFDRVAVNKGGVTPVAFPIGDNFFTLTNNNGQEVEYAGVHYFDITNGYGTPVTFSITLPSYRVVRSNAVPV